jgi:hypothetical protein
MVLKDERAVIPIGSFHKTLGVTLSLPSVWAAAASSMFWSRNSRTKSKSVWGEQRQNPQGRARESSRSMISARKDASVRGAA